MPIPTLTRAQLAETLAHVGLAPGDGVMVHAALQFLGRPEGGVEMVLETLLDILGPAGTLVSPTFTLGFPRSPVFDPAATPSQDMGVLAEAIRTHPAARRTPHPMQSIAAIGAHAAELAACDTPSAFETGSAFDRLLALDFKLLLLGAGVEFVSMIHYSEQQANVPYRYWKGFTGQVRNTAGEWEPRTIRMFARNLDIDPQVHAGPVQRLLEQRGLWQSHPLHFGRVAACRLRDFVQAANDILAEDAWGLVVKKGGEESGIRNKESG